MKKLFALILALSICLLGSQSILAEDEYYMMTVKTLDGETGEITYEEIQVEGTEPVSLLSDEPSEWETIVQEAEAAGIHPMECYFSEQPTGRALLQKTRSKVSNAKTSPYSGIVFFNLYYKNTTGPYWGTGFWVGNDKIVTCAHNVWPVAEGNKGQLTKIMIYTARNGAESTSLSTITNEPLSSFTINVPNEWDNNGSFPAASDYAVIKLKSNVNPGTHTTFNMATTYSTTKLYTVAGYPEDQGREMWEDSSKVLALKDNPGRIAYKMDAIKGQSGAPIFSGTTVIGFHAYEDEKATASSYNRGTQVTSALKALVASV